MLNPIARNLLMAHYEEVFQPLNDPEFAERDSDAHPCGGLVVVRMLTRTPDGRLMQAVATIGASQRALPRDKRDPNSGEARNEYVIFVPADWDLDKEENQWVLDLLGDLADYTCGEVERPLTYGHRLDMYGGDPDALPEGVNMTGCILLEPFGGQRPELRSLRTGLFSRVSLLHAMPLTAGEMEMDEEALQERFYPASGEVRFLCARSR